MRVIGGLLAFDRDRVTGREAIVRMAQRAGVPSAHTATAGPLGLFRSTAPIPAREPSPVRLAAELDLTNATDIQDRTGRTSTDDAVVALYEQRGPAFVDDLQGGFAIALWDSRERRLLLAVDRFGIGRLYYAVTSEHVAFASYATALCAVPSVDVSPDPVGVVRYLNFGYVPGPESIYRGLRRIMPGHLVTFRDRQPTVARYWALRYTERRLPLSTATEEAYRLTDAAVGRALEGALPKDTGAFLSGGTDSSTVVGLMTRSTGERVNAFSIGFGEARYDELDYAKLAAAHFDAAHYTHIITPDEAFALLPRLVDAYDEPFGNDSAIGTAMCAQLAADCGVRRLMAGDGGDEIFGGNERYRTDAVLGLYHRIPQVLRRGAIEPVLSRLGDGGSSPVGRAQRYVRRANIPNPARFYSYEFYFFQHADELLAPELVEAARGSSPLDVLETHWRECDGTAELNRLLYLDMKLTIGDNDLYKVTRTAELAGVRVVFPMLDVSLVEFMAAVPARFKVRGFEKRYLFKRAFRQLLPAATLAKRKHGFGVPTSIWLRDDRRFAELARDALLSRSTRSAAWFRPGALEGLFRLHATDTTSFYGALLWNVLMLELWHRRHASGQHP